MPGTALVHGVTEKVREGGAASCPARLGSVDGFTLAGSGAIRERG